MFITGFEEFLNVWANDGAKISIFIFVFTLPLLVRIIYSFKKSFFFEKTGNKVFKRDIQNIIFYVVIFFCLLSVLSIGQFILPPLIDAIIRSVGIFIYLSAVFAYLLFVRQMNFLKKESDLFESVFYNYSRNPDLALLFFILTGLSLSSLSFFGLVFSFFAYLPFSVYRALDEEKELLRLYRKYSDYKDENPLFLPDIWKLFKKIIYKDFSKKINR
jgi:protein-S-isoprenylcysteine O-methyltransferase Ste14